MQNSTFNPPEIGTGLPLTKNIQFFSDRPGTEKLTNAWSNFFWCLGVKWRNRKKCFDKWFKTFVWTVIFLFIENPLEHTLDIQKECRVCWTWLHCFLFSFSWRFYKYAAYRCITPAIRFGSRFFYINRPIYWVAIRDLQYALIFHHHIHNMPNNARAIPLVLHCCDAASILRNLCYPLA